MNKNMIIQQKQEIERLLTYDYILRENLDKITKFIDSDMIKIITGPRRAGKTIFCFQLIKGKSLHT